MEKKGFDFIGDIHGFATELKRLLGNLGYHKKEGVYSHPERTAVFVGDFIDRGPENLEVVRIVRNMVSAGSAKAIMGNHEYNAIGYHSVDIDGDRQFFRKHSESNTSQHIDFLEEQTVYPVEAGEAIKWFKSLPLFLDEHGFRCVHACWDPKFIDESSKLLNPDKSMPKKFMVRSFKNGSKENQIIETLLKGPEEEIAAGDVPFLDPDGNLRKNRRIEWWKGNRSAASPNSCTERVPTFFGHYWLDGPPVPLSDELCCVDYSIARKGYLACYRWDGERVLSQEKFAVEPHMENYLFRKEL